jgi:hypothetical protein
MNLQVQEGVSVINGTLRAALFITKAVLLGARPGIGASHSRTERVHFKPGTTSAVLEASIKGYETVDYVLGARKGQYMNVSMATNNGANHFNILAPGESDVAMVNGSTAQNQYEGSLPESGDYKIRVYLERSAARRNEVAKYRLEMIVTTPDKGSVPAARAADDNLARAIRKALGGDWEAHYFDARVDLNGDGRQEVVAMVAGLMVCGTGGCPVFVFTPGTDGYRLVSNISVVQPPVRVSSRRSKGWRNLVVGIGGGGIPAGNAELKFDGKSYPHNPTVPPAVPRADVEGTDILIPQFASYKDGKPLIAEPAK